MRTTRTDPLRPLARATLGIGVSRVEKRRALLALFWVLLFVAAGVALLLQRPARAPLPAAPETELADDREPPEERAALVEESAARAPLAVVHEQEQAQEQGPSAPAAPAGSAELTLLVVDAAGHGVEGLIAWVRVAGEEQENVRVEFLEANFDSARALPPARPRTDQNGRISLAVPSLAELTVHLEEGDSRAWSADRVRDGVLRTDASGDPIVLATGETRELRFEIGHSLAVSGIVRYPDHSPVPSARLRVFDAEPAHFGAFQSRLNAGADEHGRFGFVLHDLASDCTVSIVAADGEFISMGKGGIEHAASLSFSPAEWQVGPLELVIDLERTLDLSGRVVDDRGEPFDGVIWAIPAYAEFLLQKDSLGILPISFLPAKGNFTIKGLPPGTYDIVVKRNAPRTYHRFDGFEAGSTGIELAIEDDRIVRVRLRVDGGPADARLQAVLLRHQYRTTRPAAPLDATAAVRLEAKEPPGIRAEPGSWNQEDLEGRTIQLVGEQELARSHAFEPQQPGWYTVGVRAWDGEGLAFAPCFSGPVELDGGDYEFVARLVR
jgi:hypothetical protein